MYLLVLEDANLILQLSRGGELTVTDDILCNFRKGNIHIMASTQSPAELGPGLPSNSANKIVFRLGSGRDVDVMQRHMGVADPEEKAYFYKLKQEEFEAIVEFTKRARPFLARIIKVNLLSPMSKEELYRNNARIIQGFSIPALRAQEKKEEKQGIADDDRKWLMAVYLNQYRKTVTEIHDAVGFSASKGTKIKDSLEGGNLIKIVEIVKGKGTSKYPILLPEAYKILNLEEKKFYGKGAGYEHVVWQHLIAEHFREHKAEIELNKNGKFIDVAVQHEGRLIAAEIAMTSANEKANIEKDINLAKADFVIIGCRDEKVLNEVKAIIQELSEDLRNKARALLLSRILNTELSQLTGG